MGFLSGKKILVTGVISNRSIAFGVAKAARREGAEIALTYQNERFKERVEEMAKELGSNLALPCEVTSDAEIGQDLTELFNYLTTGYRPKRQYRKLLPAPALLKKTLLARIEREIGQHSAASPGLIQMKMNALEDADVTRALYRATQAGVRVDLIVRDTCRLRPGVPGVSESARVVSVVGRYLEHGRLYYFRNGGEDEYLIGSADCMKRNLESRIEVVVPVEDPALRKNLREVLDAQLDAVTGAWDMQPDGSYCRRQAAPDAKSSQQILVELAEKRSKGATRRRRRKPRQFPRRPPR